MEPHREMEDYQQIEIDRKTNGKMSFYRKIVTWRKSSATVNTKRPSLIKSSHSPPLKESDNCREILTLLRFVWREENILFVHW